ncbi:hypothetical protein [Streptomyces tauricus]
MTSEKRMAPHHTALKRLVPRRPVVAVTAVALLLPLAGCGGDAEAGDGSTVTVTVELLGRRLTRWLPRTSYVPGTRARARTPGRAAPAGPAPTAVRPEEARDEHLV